MRLDSRPFAEILLDLTNVTEEAIETATRESGQAPDQILTYLVEHNLITEKERKMVLGAQWGIRFVSLEEEEISEEVLQILPPQVMLEFRAVPYRVDGNRLTVAMANPMDVFTMDQIREFTSFESVVPVIACESAIEEVAHRADSAADDLRERVGEIIEGIGDAGEVEEVRTIEDEDDASPDDAPTIKLVDMIISQGVKQGASDIHIQPEAEHMRVRYRINGMLHDTEWKVPKQAQTALVARVKIMANLRIDEKRRPQDGRISRRIGGKEYDFRLNVLPCANGEKCVLRILDRSSLGLGLEQLGFAPDTLARFNEIVAKPWGIVLVTGPTGSGKSTTLYSVLAIRNTGEVNIMTVEDPVEYQLYGLTQSNVNVKAGLTFAEVLRAMLRQDPNIIMVGEIRDRETAVIATEAALTGHLVFSTLHTNDAPGAIQRLLQMDIEPFLIASSVEGILAQRLLRRVCPKCAEPFVPPEKSLRRIKFPEDQISKARFRRGKGCEACRDTGYKGRTGCFELLVMTDEIRGAVLREEPAHIIGDIARAQGMRTLAQDAMIKVAKGETTPEELLRECYSQ